MKKYAQTFKHKKCALVAAVSSVLIHAFLIGIGIAIALFMDSRRVIVHVLFYLVIVSAFLAIIMCDDEMVLHSKLAITPSLFLVSVLKGVSLFLPAVVLNTMMFEPIWSWIVWVPIVTFVVIYLANLAILNRNQGGASCLLIIHIAVTFYLVSLDGW